MSRWIVDASLSLGWYLKDELDCSYDLEVLAGLTEILEGLKALPSYSIRPSRTATKHTALKRAMFSCGVEAVQPGTVAE